MFDGVAFLRALQHGQQAGDRDAAATLGQIWPSPPRTRSMPLVLCLPQGFSPSPPPCPAHGRRRMSDTKPHISFTDRFIDRAIVTSFNEVAPSSPLPPGRIPFSPIAYVIRFGLPPAAAGGPDPSSLSSQ
jgi:hypothetical protein